MNAGVASLMTWRSDGSGPVSPAAGVGMLEASRSLFTHYRRLGQTVEPGLLLPVLIAQTHTLRELSAQSDSSTRRRLLALGSRYAEYVGWLVQETGDERAALWWTQRAVDLAAAGGDQALAGYALVRRALVTLYREDAETRSSWPAGRRAACCRHGSAVSPHSAKRRVMPSPVMSAPVYVPWTGSDPARPPERRHRRPGDRLHASSRFGRHGHRLVPRRSRAAARGGRGTGSAAHSGRPGRGAYANPYGVRRALAYASAGEIPPRLRADGATARRLDGGALGDRHDRSPTARPGVGPLPGPSTCPGWPAPRLGTLSRPTTPLEESPS